MSLKIYEKLIKIENEFEGNEYFEHGVSYCIGFDALDTNIPLKDAVKNILVGYKAIDESKEIILEEISDYKCDIKALFQEWHLEIITKEVIEVIGDNSKVYKLSDHSNIGCSYGSINSVFRVIESETEYILVEIYVTD